MRLHPSLLAAVILGAGLGLFIPSAQTQVVPAQASYPRRTDVVNVVKRVGGAVVNIHSERNERSEGLSPGEFFMVAPSQSRTNGMGTGVVIDSRGYIITNQHVVEGVNIIRIRLHDGTSVSARVMGVDNEVDLALLKIDIGRALPVMPMGTAADLMVGETVVAIGNAYGYPDSVTVGIVSAIKRDVTLNKEMSYKNLIQTSAPINPGNSGGPLLNINGEMVGINVAIRAGAQGIGFAIPVDTVLRTAADLMSIRKRNGTWHGMILRDDVLAPRDDDSADGRPSVVTTSNLTTAVRRLVIERPEANSPAAKAGLQRGDVVTQVGDAHVTSDLELERAMLDHAAGEHMLLHVQRNGHEERVELVLQTAERAAPPSAEVVWRKMGLRLNPVNAELVSRTNQQLHGGLSVADIRPDSAAGKAGIQRGDILVGLHQWEMLSLDNVVFVLTHADLATFSAPSGLKFYIVRSGQVHRGYLQQID